jgi:hypothetical protein
MTTFLHQEALAVKRYKSCKNLQAHCRSGMVTLGRSANDSLTSMCKCLPMQKVPCWTLLNKYSYLQRYVLLNSQVEKKGQKNKGALGKRSFNYTETPQLHGNPPPTVNHVVVYNQRFSWYFSCANRVKTHVPDMCKPWVWEEFGVL